MNQRHKITLSRFCCKIYRVRHDEFFFLCKLMKRVIESSAHRALNVLTIYHLFQFRKLLKRDLGVRFECFGESDGNFDLDGKFILFYVQKLF